MSSTAEYGALSTKVRAIYGRRLKYQDFVNLASMATVADAMDYLRNTGWAPAMEQLNGVPLRRSTLESALRNQVREEFVRVSSFVPRSDKAIMEYPVRKAELEGILYSLRRIKAGRIKAVEPLSARFIIHSKMNYQALTTCQDYDGLLEAAEHSIYYDALRHLRPEEAGALPDYATVEALLNAVYFSYFFRLVEKEYTGEVKKDLLRSNGVQVDLLNILHVLRLKTYFPDETNFLPVLLPFHYRLKPDQLRALCSAPSPEAVFELLKGTSYAKAFENIHVSEIEDYYRRTLYIVNKRLLTTGTPSVCTAIAFLTLRDLERQAVCNVIESVNYGVTFDDSFVRLFGT